MLVESVSLNFFFIIFFFLQFNLLFYLWSAVCVLYWMGGACSRKRNQWVDDDSMDGGASGRYCKSGSSKWLGRSLSRASSDAKQGTGKCRSLMELCICRICEVCLFFVVLLKLISVHELNYSPIYCYDRKLTNTKRSPCYQGT